MPEQLTSANFSFLATHDAQLVRLGALAERYFTDDPNTSLLKLRQYGETLAQLVAAKSGLFRDAQENTVLHRIFSQRHSFPFVMLPFPRVLDRLDQVTLAKAFKGDLVPQEC